MTQQFKNILIKANPMILENPDADLVNDGIVDSLDIMNIIAMCEETFDIDIDPGDVLPENFATADSIWKLIQKYKEGE